MRKIVVKVLATDLLVGLVLSVCYLHIPFTDFSSSEPDAAMAIRPHVKGSAEWYASKMDECWRNDGLDHPTATHVIYRPDAGEWHLTNDEQVMHRALLQELPKSLGGDGRHHGIVVYKFCA